MKPQTGSEFMGQNSALKASFCRLRPKPDRRITKAGSRFRECRESRKTLAKLQDMVPTLPANIEVSHLELLQHVINYIADLQRQLVTDPIDEQFTPKLMDLESLFQLSAHLGMNGGNSMISDC